MEPPEPTIESFVVKIWIDIATQPSWHGYITHVSDGKRSYLHALDDIPEFIEPYLRRAGVAADTRRS